MTLADDSGILAITVGAQEVSEASIRPKDGTKFSRTKLSLKEDPRLDGRVKTPDLAFRAEKVRSIRTRVKKERTTKFRILRRKEYGLLRKSRARRRGTMRITLEPLPACIRIIITKIVPLVRPILDLPHANPKAINAGNINALAALRSVWEPEKPR
jgi:hypothetical protein